MSGVSGRVIVITGATSGIGAATARALAADDAVVAVTGRDTIAGEAVARDIRNSGKSARFFRLDVTEVDAWPARLATIADALGPIRGMVSNVGECILKPIGELSSEDLRFLLRINVENSFLAFKHGVPAVRAGGGGSIVAVSSVAGIRADARSTAYSASKAAIEDLARLAAREGAAQAPFVQVNVVMPGLVWSEGIPMALGRDRACQMYDKVMDGTPLGRPGAAEDIASGIKFILSGAAPLLTGTPLIIDGGFSA